MIGHRGEKICSVIALQPLENAVYILVSGGTHGGSVSVAGQPVISFLIGVSAWGGVTGVKAFGDAVAGHVDRLYAQLGEPDGRQAHRQQNYGDKFIQRPSIKT
jgi:hypothetical protein